MAKSRSPPFCAGARVLRVLLGQVLELGAALDLRDQRLGLVFVLDQDVARAVFGAGGLGLELVVLGLGLGVGDRVLLLEVLEQLADQDALARQFHLRAVVGRGGDALLLGLLREDLAQHDLVAWPGLPSPGRPSGPARAACCSRLSTRAFGTALPLTMAMFCAWAASGHQQARRTAATNAARTAWEFDFMSGVSFLAWRSMHGATARRSRRRAHGQDRSGSVGIRARRAHAPRWPTHGCRRASTGAGHHTRGDVAPRGCSR